MVSARLRATDYVLWTAALAWPLGVFLQTPVPGVNVLTLLGLVLLFLVMPEALSERKLRIPIELWAPMALLALLAAAGSVTGPRPVYWDVAEGLILLALVLQAAPARDAIRRYVFTGTISSGIVATLSLITPVVGLLPTAFTLRSGAALTFPYGLDEGVHMLLTGVAFSFYVVSDRGFVTWKRAISGVSLALAVALLIVLGGQWWREAHMLPAVAYPKMGVGRWIAIAVGLWLFARVVAKTAVDHSFSPDPLQRLWWMLAAITVLVAAFTPLHPRGYQGLLLGFAAASALPPRLTAQVSRWPIIGSGVLTIFLLINLIVVFPSNTTDPRQYDAAAQREVPRVFDRMDWVDRHAPHERRTFLWRARAAMESGLPNLASFAFERGARPPDGPTVLAPPTEPERQQFMVRMRDIVAGLPQDRAVCAYERVLLANGERDSALYSLRLLTGVSMIHAPGADAALFTRVAGLVVGDSTIAEDMRSWSADEVLTLLSQWGADVTFRSGVAETPGVLFVLAAQRTWDTFTVHIRVGEQVTERAWQMRPVAERDIEPLRGVSAMVWAGPDAAGPGRYELNVVAGGRVRPAAYVDVAADGSAVFMWAEDPPVIPFTPAIRVRLPK